MFLVNVAFKGFSLTVSPLFATVAGVSVNVAAKGLKARSVCKRRRGPSLPLSCKGLWCIGLGYGGQRKDREQRSYGRNGEQGRILRRVRPGLVPTGPGSSR